MWVLSPCCQPGLAVELMSGRGRATAAVSLGSAPLMKPSVMSKPSSQARLPVLMWVQQKLHWSSWRGCLPHWLCEFTLSDGSSLGTDSLPGFTGAGFLY